MTPKLTHFSNWRILRRMSQLRIIASNNRLTWLDEIVCTLSAIMRYFGLHESRPRQIGYMPNGRCHENNAFTWRSIRRRTQLMQSGPSQQISFDPTYRISSCLSRTLRLLILRDLRPVADWYLLFGFKNVSDQNFFKLLSYRNAHCSSAWLRAHQWRSRAHWNLHLRSHLQYPRD